MVKGKYKRVFMRWWVLINSKAQDSRTWGDHHWLDSLLGRFLSNGNVGRSQWLRKKRILCTEYWIKKKFQGSRERYTGHRDITEIIKKRAVNTILLTNHMSCASSCWFGFLQKGQIVSMDWCNKMWKEGCSINMRKSITISFYYTPVEDRT